MLLPLILSATKFPQLFHSLSPLDVPRYVKKPRKQKKTKWEGNEIHKMRTSSKTMMLEWVFERENRRKGLHCSSNIFFPHFPTLFFSFEPTEKSSLTRLTLSLFYNNIAMCLFENTFHRKIFSSSFGYFFLPLSSFSLFLIFILANPFSPSCEPNWTHLPALWWARGTRNKRTNELRAAEKQKENLSTEQTEVEEKAEEIQHQENLNFSTLPSEKFGNSTVKILGDLICFSCSARLSKHEIWHRH